MILSYRDSRTRNFAEGRFVRGFEAFRRQAEKRLDILDAATGLDGKGAHVVWDGVGGPISVATLRGLRFGGRFCIVGWAATPFVARGKGQRGAPNANQLPTNLIMMKGLDVLGCPTAISTHHDPSIRAERLARILEWARAGKLKPCVGPSYPLAEVKEALRAKWASEFVGGCVLKP